MSGSSFGKSESNSDSRSNTFVSPQQAPFLGDLYRRAQVASAGSGIPGTANTLVNQLLPGAQSALGQLTSNPFLENLYGRATGSNPDLQAAIDAGTRDIGRTLSEEVLPAIRQGAGLGGVRGGSRQYISEGIAGRGAVEAAGDLSRGLRFQDYFAGQQAATAGAGLLGQGARDTAALSPSVFNLGLGGQTASFLPLEYYARLLGAPTVLGSSVGSGSGSSFNIGFG